MNRALIIFASREGQTEKVAARIGQHLEDHGLTVRLINAADSAALGEIELAAYDLLVFGASLHAGGLERELVQFVDDNVAEIEQKARSFFLLSLSAATRDPGLRAESLADALEKMRSRLSVEFADVEMIAGALRYSKYPRPLKWLMKRIAASAGEITETDRDYEYTDWEQVARYAARLAAI